MSSKVCGVVFPPLKASRDSSEMMSSPLKSIKAAADDNGPRMKVDFVTKLWEILEKPEYRQLISWTQARN